MLFNVHIKINVHTKILQSERNPSTLLKTLKYSHNNPKLRPL